MCLDIGALPHIRVNAHYFVPLQCGVQGHTHFSPQIFFFFWSVEEKKGNNYLIFSGERKKSIAIAKNALNRDQNKLIVLYK